jgi:antitoxin (DNA-binding transcriptional repressor) of toxin-antitoxin stability system
VLRPAILLKRSLIFLHRWMGVALSAIFLLWFSSGIVMMYWSFPDVSAEDRLARAPTLDPASIKISPEEAYAALEGGQPAPQAVLTSFDGRPVYRFDGQAMVYADTGARQTDVSDSMLDRVAAAWTGQPAASATKESVDEVDQWTVGMQLRRLRPLFKYSFADGQQVYVSARDAEVKQYTTTSSRWWAYLGAIPHWMYFLPLRKHAPEWSQFVIWSSGIAGVAALLGILVALWMLSPTRRYRIAGAPTSVPYRGWKRWHMILGLVFGTVAATWAFSGLLSMGPFGLVERLTSTTVESGHTINLGSALRGDDPLPLASYAAKSSRDAVAVLGSDFEVKELEFAAFAGEPVYIASDGQGATRIVPVNGTPQAEFDRGRIEQIVRETAGADLAELRWMEEYDAYYLDRTGRRPLPVILVRLNDRNQTRYYIDPKTARIAGDYSAGEWVNRWLYHGLHSMDFPWLYNHRPLWDIVVISLLSGGTALCITSLLLAWRVLKRKILAMAGATPRPAQAGDDLAVEGD